MFLYTGPLVIFLSLLLHTGCRSSVMIWACSGYVNGEFLQWHGRIVSLAINELQPKYSTKIYGWIAILYQIVLKTHLFSKLTKLLWRKQKVLLNKCVFKTIFCLSSTLLNGFQIDPSILYILYIM